MNKKVLKIKRTMMLILTFMLIVTSVYPICTFADSAINKDNGSYENKLVYKSTDAWPADGFSEADLKNDDPVWRFLYRDNATVGAEKEETDAQYKAYTIAKAGNSGEFAAPISNGDGTYDYGLSGADQIVYSDGTANPGMRNAMGKYWMRLSVAGGSEPKKSVSNRIVKAFTAPRSGNVSVSAEDMSGAAKIYNKTISSANITGAVVKVIKKTAEATDEKLWKHKFVYNKDTTPANGIESVDFENLSVHLNQGEQLWFVVSGEATANGWALQVFWNPTVTYSYGPESITPSDLSAVFLEQDFTVTFPDELEDMTEDCILISGKG